jgi:uncharacterized cupin superfamily protein
MFFILEGALTIEIDGKVTILEAGDSVHFPSSRTHATWNHHQQADDRAPHLHDGCFRRRNIRGQSRDRRSRVARDRRQSRTKATQNKIGADAS